MLYKYNLKILIIPLFCLLFILVSCRPGSYKIPKPNISDISADDVHIIRFDKMLFAVNGHDHVQHLKQIESQYPEIFRSYSENYWGIIQTDSTRPVNVYDSLNNLVLSNAWMNRLYDSVQLIYNDISDVEKDLKEAVRYYRYYFPDSVLPQIYSYIGPFVYWTIIDENTLGIELDMYMGEHFGYYGNFENNMPQYITVRCNKEYIVVNVMETFMDGNIPGKGSEATLLDEMVKKGKMLYYLDLMLPDLADSIKMGYTEQQIEWCKDNEDEIWKFLVGEELLFSKKTDHFRKYLDEAPYSVGMPEDSPGRVAAWVGWQIVRTYMKEHEENDIYDLFYEIDGLTLLKESGYDPGG